MASLFSTEAEAGIDSGVHSTGVRAREWWERYILLVVPVLLLTVALAYIIPSNPDLVMYFAVWMLLVNVALCFLAWRVATILSSPAYKSVEFKPDGSPVTVQKRRFVRWMISAGALMVVFGSLQGISLWSRGDYEFGGRSLLSFLIISLFFTTLFVFMWSERAPRVERLMDSYTGFWLTVIFIAVLIPAVLYIISLKLPAQLVQGPPAPWPKMLNFAQREAEKIDKGAVAEHISADPPYYADPPYSPESTAFHMDFVFRRPDGSSIRIETVDTDPPMLRRVYDKWDYMAFQSGASLPPDLLASYAANLSYVKLSARDAYRLTEQEGLAFARQLAPEQAPDVHMSLILSHDWRERFGAPAGWNISYTVVAGGEYRTLNLRVDGATGKVLARERWPEDLKANSTPTPLTIRQP